MTDRINLMDLQKKNVDVDELKKQYGLSDDHLRKLERVHILTFYQSEKDEDRIYAKLDNGGVVFRHQHGGMIIQPGETWIVEVEKKKTTFFAKGLIKLDSQFFFDLRVDQVDVVADTIWKKYNSIIEPLLEERYKEQLRGIIEKELQSEKNKEIEKYKQDIQKLEDEVQKEKEKYAQLKTKMTKQKTTKKKSKKKTESTKTKKGVEPVIQIAELKPVIRRVKPDVLESEQFTKDHYFVHISSDQRIMTIVPHERGPIPCVNHQLHLKGLGLISEFGGPYDMPVDYDPKYGGYKVYLKYTATSIRTSK